MRLDRGSLGALLGDICHAENSLRGMEIHEVMFPLHVTARPRAQQPDQESTSCRRTKMRTWPRFTFRAHDDGRHLEDLVLVHRAPASPTGGGLPTSTICLGGETGGRDRRETVAPGEPDGRNPARHAMLFGADQGGFARHSRSDPRRRRALVGSRYGRDARVLVTPFAPHSPLDLPPCARNA